MDEIVYQPGGYVRAPNEDGIVGEWFISNEGRSWFVITRGAAHRVVTRAELDTWQRLNHGDRVELVNGTLPQEVVEMVDSTADATRRTRDAIAAGCGRIYDRFVDIAAVVAVCGGIYVVVSHTIPSGCA